MTATQRRVRLRKIYQLWRKLGELNEMVAEYLSIQQAVEACPRYDPSYWIEQLYIKA